ETGRQVFASDSSDIFSLIGCRQVPLYPGQNKFPQKNTIVISPTQRNYDCVIFGKFVLAGVQRHLAAANQRKDITTFTGKNLAACFTHRVFGMTSLLLLSFVSFVVNTVRVAYRLCSVCNANCINALTMIPAT